MTEKYKSVEQRIWDSVEPNLGLVLKGFYGICATPFRIPTFVRKMNKDQTIMDRSTHTLADVLFLSCGIALGVWSSMVALPIYCANEISKNNYAPAIATAATLAVTNIASGVYESIRNTRKGIEDKLEAGAK